MLKILMVDDEKWVRTRFSQRIPWSNAGFELIGAASGAEEAIRMMERELPHLLLTDITMPNMNGLELAAYVRRKWPQVRIVILTAYGEFEYARKAIELGVDNYLIKLAQTPEQILDVCRKVAESLEQELDIHEKLAMRLRLEQEKEWTKKSRWMERIIDEEGLGERQAVPKEWLEEVESSHYLAGIAFSWSRPLPAGQSEILVEEQIHLGRELSEALDTKLDAQLLGESCGKAIFPLQTNQLLVLIGSKQPLSAVHLKQMAGIAQETIQASASAICSVHVGQVEEVENQQLAGNHLAEQARKGINGLAAYFYHGENIAFGKQWTEFRRLDAGRIRERTAAVAKALERENVELFRKTVADMITLSTPLIHPTDLLRLTKQVLHPEFVKLPDSVTERLREIDRLESWLAYSAWWSETIEAICEWLNHQAEPAVTVRKEIQWMCRYIREHVQEDLQVAELAKLVHMHPSYAGQMFKQEMGENFLEYVNRVRMEKASELLERTSMKIYEVSGAVGISDYRYFCKLFKSYTGFTPTKYKSRQR